MNKGLQYLFFLSAYCNFSFYKLLILVQLPQKNKSNSKEEAGYPLHCDSQLNVVLLTLVIVQVVLHFLS